MSYLLIGFWYTGRRPIRATSRRSSSTASATSASCSASRRLRCFGSLDYATVFAKAPEHGRQTRINFLGMRRGR